MKELKEEIVVPPSHNNSLFTIFYFFQNNCNFRIIMQHLFFSFIIIPLFMNLNQFNYSTNYNINDTNFTIKITTINHFLIIVHKL